MDARLATRVYWLHGLNLYLLSEIKSLFSTSSCRPFRHSSLFRASDIVLVISQPSRACCCPAERQPAAGDKWKCYLRGGLVWDQILLFGTQHGYRCIVLGQSHQYSARDILCKTVLGVLWQETIFERIHCNLRGFSRTARKIRFTPFCTVEIWCKKLQMRRKSKAKMVNTAFAYQSICGCKFVGKCGIYQLCLCLHFFAPYLH